MYLQPDKDEPSYKHKRRPTASPDFVRTCIDNLTNLLDGKITQVELERRLNGENVSQAVVVEEPTSFKPPQSTYEEEERYAIIHEHG